MADDDHPGEVWLVAEPDQTPGDAGIRCLKDGGRNGGVEGGRDEVGRSSAASCHDREVVGQESACASEHRVGGRPGEAVVRGGDETDGVGIIGGVVGLEGAQEGCRVGDASQGRGDGCADTRW